MVNETWKKIEEFPDYAVSSHGSVKRLTQGPHTRPGKIIKPLETTRGYLKVNLRKNKDGKVYTKNIHKLVAITFLGDPPEQNMHAAHNDGNKQNNHVSNIRWATAKENSDDKFRHGTVNFAKGVKAGRAKLTMRDLRGIAKLFSLGFTKDDTARLMGVNRTAASDFLNRKTYKNEYDIIFGDHNVKNAAS